LSILYEGLFLKKLLFLILFFTATLLLANEQFDTFIEQQMKVEKQLMDNNISSKERKSLRKAQVKDYQEFFLQYAADKNEVLSKLNPYKQKIDIFKLRYRNNKHRNYKIATLRDELLIKSLTIKSSMLSTLNDALMYADSESKKFYKDKIFDSIMKHFSTYKPIDPKKYILKDKNNITPLEVELSMALKNTIALEYVANTFSAELVENSTNIYRTALLSKSKLFTFVSNINKSKAGQIVNSYLSPLGIDTAKLILIIIIILFIIFVQKLITFIINRFLHHHKLKDDDIEYIHTHITNIFNIITSLVIIHVVIVVVLGFDSKSISISKLFAVLYIVLVALLLYRITNTIAYLKMERMKRNAALKNEVVNLSLKAINGLILLLCIIAILKVMGVDLTAVLSGLGIAGAAVAFAAKDSIANIFGSIAILAGDIFEQGDWIETNHADGTVVEIGLRATTIRTFDNALISVPNFELSNTGVKNWTRRRIGRRIKMKIGVTYESDFKDIKQAVDEIRVMLKEHPGIANEHTSYLNSDRHAKLVSVEDFKGIKRTTLVFMDEFADSSINILLYCFTRTVIWNEWLEVKEDIMYKVADILKRNNLEFAYPTLTIHQASEADDNTLEKRDYFKHH
jgi:MscS family membrane protein